MFLFDWKGSIDCCLVGQCIRTRKTKRYHPKEHSEISQENYVIDGRLKTKHLLAIA